MGTITGEQDVFGGVNQAGAASGDYAAIYNACQLCVGVAKGSTVNTNSFTITGSGGRTGKYLVSSVCTGVLPLRYEGAAVSLMTGATAVATFGAGEPLGSVVATLAAGTYFWQITVGNPTISTPGSGDPVYPANSNGIPNNLDLFVIPV